MSFLDRFRGKIATVTAQGHLKKADGSEEIRVGAPKRRPQRQIQKPSQQLSDNNKDQHDVCQPTKIHSRTDVDQAAVLMPAPSRGNESKRLLTPTKEFPIVTLKENPNNNQLQSAREAVRYEYNEPAGVPGRVSDEAADFQPSSDVLTLKSNGGGNSNTRIQSMPQESRLQKESHACKVASDPNQLAFSRKARPVQYEPCKLSQYRKEKPDGYYELGKLQPDLNTNELVEKRAKIDRMKAFSHNRRTINRIAQARKPVEVSSEQADTSKPASTREKGIAFAKGVPKPRSSHKTDLESSTGSRKLRTQSIELKGTSAFMDDESDDDELDAELQLLQQRHEASRAEVKAFVGSA